MKTTLLVYLILILLSGTLYAQEKGITPLSPSAEAAGGGNTYAVVVGISDYQDPEIPDLRFADRDALAFAGFLQSPAGGGLDQDHLTVMINEQATVAQFAMQLDWLLGTVKENDRVIIFFSGHGDVEKKSITQPGYLLCWDAPAHVYLAGGALNIRDLNDVVSTLSIQNKAKVVLITDACRAGKLSGSEIGGALATASNLAKQFANEIKILSCQANEYSIEGEQWGGGHGAFSYHLIDGLYGLADQDADGIVNLMEMRRYLEEKVPAEVAPQNQIPMVVGELRERLALIIPELLDELKSGRKGQLALFTRTESRAIEDDVLAAANSNIVAMYAVFKQAIKDKQFLQPGNACADFYYEILSREPQLERLHASMRRNYAAALQDDAQQVLNIMLKSGLTEQVLKSTDAQKTYANYPEYLERAAALLGKEHYMHTTLLARKYFFQGMLAKDQDEAKINFKKALDLQSEMPHAMVHLSRNFNAAEADSAELYAQKAMAIVPSWVEPYVALAQYYLLVAKQPHKAEDLLRRAGEVDSSSVLVWYTKANFYFKKGDFKEAEKWFLKIIAGIGQDICFPCAYLNLGGVYLSTGRYEEAKPYILKSLELDSISAQSYTSYCRPCAFINLSYSSYFMGQSTERKLYLYKAIQADSTFAMAHYNLGSIFNEEGRYAEAETYLLQALKFNNQLAPAWVNIGHVYYRVGRLEEAEAALKKALAINYPSAHPNAHGELGIIYRDAGRYEEAREHFNKALELNPKFIGAMVNLSILYLRTNALEDARELLDKAKASNPNHPYTLLGLAQLAAKENQFDLAWQYLEQVLEKEYKEYIELQSEPNFDAMRISPKWDALMKKYFPEQIKD